MKNTKQTKKVVISTRVVQYDFIHDCFNTDDQTEFFVQDKITEILTKALIK